MVGEEKQPSMGKGRGQLEDPGPLLPAPCRSPPPPHTHTWAAAVLTAVRPLPLQEDPGGHGAHVGLQLRGGQRGRQGAALLLRGHRVQGASALAHSPAPPRS